MLEVFDGKHYVQYAELVLNILLLILLFIFSLWPLTQSPEDNLDANLY